jgi:hypothetical protein
MTHILLFQKKTISTTVFLDYDIFYDFHILDIWSLLNNFGPKFYGREAAISILCEVCLQLEVWKHNYLRIKVQLGTCTIFEISNSIC